MRTDPIKSCHDPLDPSSQYGHFGSVDCIARIAEITDADQSVGAPVQYNEIDRFAQGVGGIANQCRSAAIDEARREPPVPQLAVDAKIFGDVGLAGHLVPRHEIEPYLLPQHRPDAVDVAGVE